MQIIIILVCIGLGMASNVEAEMIAGIEFPEGSRSFADEFVSYTQGSENVSNDHNKPLLTLGIPDDAVNGKDGYLSLGDGGGSRC